MGDRYNHHNYYSPQYVPRGQAPLPPPPGSAPPYPGRQSQYQQPPPTHHPQQQEQQQQQQQQQQPSFIMINPPRPSSFSRENGSESGGESTVRTPVSATSSGYNNQPPPNYGSGPRMATHDISRVSYHLKDLGTFAKTLEDSASKAFPNRGRSSRRYNKVYTLLLHWKIDDLFVLPELEDLRTCLAEDYGYETDTYAIPSENAHLELMLKMASMIKEHEAPDTLLIVYYGSPWLQWSAIQTLLERSVSDTLILLDCCAGAASATFSNNHSITETISASSWDAIAPDPGRYSFTNALIEVLQEWRRRTFSAAMLHAEVLARLKHPRPIRINGKQFEARSTPVHFMMTSNHKAPSIEITRLYVDDRRTPSPQNGLALTPASRGAAPGGSSGAGDPLAVSLQGVSEPSMDVPHVMVTLALEEDQQLDLGQWEAWLASFPALAKFVKVQGVFRSHSTLLLLSLPVMVWDLMPDNLACSFVAFIRSNNLMVEKPAPSKPKADVEMTVDSGQTSRPPVFKNPFAPVPLPQQPYLPALRSDTETIDSDNTALTGSTAVAPDGPDFSEQLPCNPLIRPQSPCSQTSPQNAARRHPMPSGPAGANSFLKDPQLPRPPVSTSHASSASVQPSEVIQRERTASRSNPTSSTATTSRDEAGGGSGNLRTPRPSAAEAGSNGPRLAQHIEERLEKVFQDEQYPDASVRKFLASAMGITTRDLDMWFHHRLQQQQMAFQLQSLRIQDQPHENASDGARMILPGHLNKLLQIFPSNQVLLLDLRSAVDFQKTHIHGAVNFRVPLTFVQNAPLETVTDAIVDNESRRTFLKWQSSRCVVLYDRHVEFAWECPVADALYRKFRARGWPGQVFILKGYFLEFSRSFEQYIGGDRMTQSGKDYADSLRERVGASFSTSASVAPDYNEDSASYAEWLRLLESEGRVPTTHLVPARKQERIQSVEERQRTIELEFQRHFPILWKKFEANQLVDHTPTFEPGVGRGLSDVAVPIYSPCASSVYGSDDGDSTGDIKGKGKDVSAEAVTARMVEPLAAALEKMREAAESSGGGSGDLGTVSQQLLSTASILDTPSRSNSEAVPPYSPPDPDSKLGGFGLGGSDDGDEDATIATPVKCRSTYLTSSKLEYEGLAGAGVGSGVDEYELVEPTSDDIDDNKPPAYPPRGNRNSQYHHHVGGGRGGHQHQPQQQQQQQRPPFEGDATIGPAAESQRRRAGPIGIVIDRIRRTGRQ